MSRLGYHFRARRIGQPVELAGFADIPVLAEFTCEVAAGGAKGKNGRTRQEMVEGLFFDGIDAKSGRAAIGGEHHGTIFASAHETQAPLPVAQFAKAGAEIALHPAVIKCVPVAPGRLLRLVIAHHGLPVLVVKV